MEKLLPGPDALRVSLVTPGRAFFDGHAEKVVVPGHDDGEVCFLRRHAPYVGILGYGVVRIVDQSGITHRFAVHSGFVQVVHDRITILAKKAQTEAEVTAESIAAAEAELQAMPNRSDADYEERRLAAREILARKRLRHRTAG